MMLVFHWVSSFKRTATPEGKSDCLSFFALYKSLIGLISGCLHLYHRIEEYIASVFDLLQCYCESYVNCVITRFMKSECILNCAFDVMIY